MHDQSIVNAEARLVADLGVTSWLGVGLVLPYRVFHTTIRYLDPSGNQVAIENPFIHHHNETLTGVGDPWLLARVARTIGGFVVGVRGGVALPFGRTEPDPFVLGDLGLPHEHSQFGSGTFEPFVGLDVARAIGGARIDAFALSIQSLYDDSYGYRAGDRYAGGVGAASALGTARFRFRATFEAQHETAETWSGVVHSEEGNTGRTDVLAGVEATWRVTADWHLGVAAKLPLYTHVQGGQIESSPFVGVSVGMELHLFGDDSPHHHDDVVASGNWSGLDMQEATTDGSAVDLVTVRGKITVFDFWAEWCKPCHVVDHELAEVVRRHPDDFAVRKVNVVDTDSPASVKYLRDFTLPHLKVFDREGKLLWEHSSSPLALTGEIEQLVTGESRHDAIVPGALRVDIAVGDAGFAPQHVDIPVGRPVTLVFTRTSEKTCAVDVHFVLPNGTRIDELLPLGKAIEIPIELERAGVVTYTCGMKMNHGTIEAK
ncbi:MAG: cupredoxin domain-containing protein [Kofleriaceae bacterium]